MKTIITLGVCQAASLVNPSNYPKINSISTVDGFSLYFKVNSSDSSIVDFAIIVKGAANGWAGLGIDPGTTGMTNADTVMARFVNNKIEIADMFMTGIGSAPIQDTIDNLLDKDGGVSNGDLHVKFSRKINTGDTARDKIIRNETMKFSYAFSTTSNSFSSAHDGNTRGTFTTNLLQYVGTNTTSGNPNTPNINSTPNYVNFHLIVTGAVFFTVLSIGLVFTFLPIMAKPNAFTDLLLYRRFCPLIKNRYIGSVLNPLLELTIGEVLLVVTYWLILSVWAIYGGVNATSFPVGRAFAYVNVWNFSLILFPVSRYSVLLALFGISFERAVKYHKWIGRSTFFFVTCHFIAMLVENAVLGNAAYLWSMSSMSYPLLGFIAWCLLGILGLMTFEPIRRKVWELFYYSHIILALCVVALVIAHGRGWVMTLPYMACSILLFLFDLSFRWIFGFGVPTKLVSMKYDEQAKVTVLTFQKRFMTFLNIGANMNAGGFVFVYIPRVNPFGYHPFTMSSCKKLQENSVYEFTCHVRNHGKGYSKRLAELAKKIESGNERAENVSVRVEGVYGNLSIPLRSYETVVLIGGGIGVTFVNSVLEGIIQREDHKIQTVHVWWSLRQPAMIDLFPLLRDDVNASIKKQFFITSQQTEMSEQKTSASCNHAVMGKMDVKKLLESLKQQDSSKERNIGVFVCGTHHLIVDVLNTARELSDFQTRFHVHKETFEL
ncbi:hypothetical protein C9374_011428 [Naegleria lovaniensis]|uniref:FAD-binding FR-type domain-containing protein n=1 Tax=Naegleria lovaniensis TaxID=51637 RepID=A0AA88GX89_NAELO|nr:uncharacterized protein C9374_011428 [Naegleria lovaniensis]KAG2392703.1 hypothetical protein C9374_011428 [Naegleria lovaniensis]